MSQEKQEKIKNFFKAIASNDIDIVSLLLGENPELVKEQHPESGRTAFEMVEGSSIMHAVLRSASFGSASAKVSDEGFMKAFEKDLCSALPSSDSKEIKKEYDSSDPIAPNENAEKSVFSLMHSSSISSPAASNFSAQDVKASPQVPPKHALPSSSRSQSSSSAASLMSSSCGLIGNFSEMEKIRFENEPRNKAKAKDESRKIIKAKRSLQKIP